MPRIPRMKLRIVDGVYHVMSYLAIETYFSSSEKDYLLRLIQHFSEIYFTKVYGYCIMGNHFHLIVQMQEGSSIQSNDFKERYKRYREKASTVLPYRLASADNLARLKERWSDLSAFIRDIKLYFSRWYNTKHKRRGFLWGDRFKSYTAPH